MAKRRIPVVVVAGFLGSGKTTLLNHLLATSSGARIGVVVNDFGSINIDAMLVAGQVDSMVSLGNGCLCCAVDSADLDVLLDRLAEPARRIDVIVVEASGLAEPAGVIRLILASDNRRISYGGLVEVVDGAEFDRARAAHPELDRDLRQADLVVLNKNDRLDEAERRRVLELVGRLSGGVPVVPTSHGRVDPALLFDREPRPAGGADDRQLSFDTLPEYHDGSADHAHHDGPCDHEPHLHSSYLSVAFSSDRPMDPGRFMDFLDGRPTGLYRAKGFVHFDAKGYRQKFTLHTVGSYLSFQRSRWSPDEPRETRLVLIGTGVDTGELRRALTNCLRGTEDPSEGREMFRVLRHTR
ncbi:GTP-binding protein [Solihabitans fulvus]|uniref:GTP-binding protein n=1 Tax=Solihabitans fulvus TaxID=1892852 RepID=A0A5B2XEC3_9PSEU|nr:GTP-binding protein [Solihabitans fulvus]KAA2261122.1 GTP-binding protein [Solihabitans fulvus]